MIIHRHSLGNKLSGKCEDSGKNLPLYQGFPEKQNQQDIYLSISIYHEGQSQEIIEAEKSHSVPSVNWRPRKPSGLNLSLRVAEDEIRHPSSTVRQKNKGEILPQWSVCPPTLGGQSSLLSPAIGILMSSGNTLTDPPRNHVSWGHPMF